MNKQLFLLTLLACTPVISMETTPHAVQGNNEESWKNELQQLKAEWVKNGNVFPAFSVDNDESQYQIARHPFLPCIAKQNELSYEKVMNPFWRKVARIHSPEKRAEVFEEVCMNNALLYYPWEKARYTIAAGISTASVSETQRERIRELAQEAGDQEVINLMCMYVG